MSRKGNRRKSKPKKFCDPAVCPEQARSFLIANGIDPEELRHMDFCKFEQNERTN